MYTGTMKLFESSRNYLDFLDTWFAELPSLELVSLEPNDTALACVDVIEGFHRVGPLASPRVADIIPHVTSLVTRLDDAGVSHDAIVFIQDAHPEDAQEFEAYPPHCLIGSEEAAAVTELQALPNWQHYQHVTKNAIASHTSPAFNVWLEQCSASTIIAIGDVTDLCLYTLALHMQVRNLAAGLKQRIIVPANCVDTWDAPDHPADLYHMLFLHQMQRNGIEVVKSIS